MYIIRIYIEDYFIEKEAEKGCTITIGSGKKDSIQINSAEVKNNHLTFSWKDEILTVSAHGKCTYKGHEVKNQEVHAGDAFLLPGTSVAVSVSNAQTDSDEEIELSESSEILIGRSYNSTIQFDNKKVSSSHAKIYEYDGKYHICDMNSSNGTYLNGKRIKDAELNDGDVVSILTYRILYCAGKLHFENVGGDLQIVREENNHEDEDKTYPVFHRSPRIQNEMPGGKIEIQSPPSIGEKPEINWFTVVLPSVGMVAVMAFLVYFFQMSSTMLYFSAPTTLLSLAVAVLNYKSQKKKHIQKENLRLEKYEEHLRDITEKIEKNAKQQMSVLQNDNPAPTICIARGEKRKKELWNRRFTDSDFMRLRIGTGEVPFDTVIITPRKGIELKEDSLMNRAYQLADEHRTLQNAPILYDTVKDPLCGIIGERNETKKIAREMLLQASVHHSYDEVKIVLLFPQEEKETWEWARWLPHIFSDNRGERYMACTEREAAVVCRSVEEILKQRRTEIKNGDISAAGRKFPHYFFLCADMRLMKEKSILGYILSAIPEMSVSAVFLCDEMSALPKETQVIIEANQRQNVIYNKENASLRQKFRSDEINIEELEQFARSLAPVRLPISLAENRFPSCITFMEGYRKRRPDEFALEKNWSVRTTYKSMAVPLGVKENGEPFFFDIHEKKHGPHGLVAGMTGSGKSEMVQSWILSMALRFSPEDVSFVLIDFKGTGLILPFLKLPHLAGTISDLDTNIYRNLIALENELSRRKALLDEAGVNNINAYLKLQRQGSVKEPLSYLFIVIDEFAEFKVQFPDFMNVVNRIFAIGRTLGVFAILLTQKPSGVVDDKMNANTRFRWCLKVASSADSKEMLHHPDAAAITTAGRGYVQVGEDEVYELVQSYWSGAPYNPTAGRKSAAPTKISVMKLDGERVYCEVDEKTIGMGSSLNEIDVIVNYLQQYVKEKQLSSARKIWTQKLADTVYLEDILEAQFDGEAWHAPEQDIIMTAGLIDDPYSQTQYPMKINLTRDGHFAVYGAPGTGKSTMLQSLILSLLCTYDPERVNVYIMDFGGWNMGMFKDFPHVGGIANDNDSERIEKTVDLLIKELETRKQMFAQQGVGSLKAYNAAAQKPLPSIILALDNFMPIREEYPELEPFFMNLTREGGSYGIYFICTSNTTASLGYKIRPNIRQSAALQMAAKDDYADIVGKTDGLEPERKSGRGLVQGKPPLEFQAALPTKGMESERIEKIKTLAYKMNAVWKGNRAKSLPIMPEEITFGSISVPKEGTQVCLGLSCKEIEPVVFDFAKQHYLMISGTPASGKSNLLKVIAKQSQGQIYAFDAGYGSIKNATEGETCRYFTNAEEFDSFIRDFMPEMQRRKNAAEQGESLEGEQVSILIDNYKDSFEQLDNDTINRLEAIVRLGKGLEVHLITAGNSVDITRLKNSGDPLCASMTNGRFAVLLGGDMDAHQAFQSTVPYSERKKAAGKECGFFLDEGQACVFKTMSE